MTPEQEAQERYFASTRSSGKPQPKKRQPMPAAQKTSIWLMVSGVLAAIVGFLTMNTQLFLAYKGGTLANVHGLCQNPFAALGGQKVTAECASINGWYTFSEVALWGGVLIAVAGLVLLLVQRSKKF